MTKESSNFNSKAETIDLIAEQYPVIVREKIKSLDSFINELILNASYDREKKLYEQLETLGIRLVIDTNKRPSGERSGFRGIMFLDEYNNMYVAVRGTTTSTMERLRHNFLTDKAILSTGEFDLAYQQELNSFAEFIRTYANTIDTNPQILIHGHSLGGGAAQHLGLLLSMTAPKSQKVLTIASDPLATEELSNKTIAAYLSLKEDHPEETVPIRILIDKINSPKINVLIKKYLPGNASAQYSQRQAFIRGALSNSKIINFLFALQDKEGIHLSPVSTIHRQPGESILAISQGKEKKHKVKTTVRVTKTGTSKLLYRGVDMFVRANTKAIHNLKLGAIVHEIETLKNANKFIAIGDSDFLHRGLKSQVNLLGKNLFLLQEVEENSISMRKMLNSSRSSTIAKLPTIEAINTANNTTIVSPSRTPNLRVGCVESVER